MSCLNSKKAVRLSTKCNNKFPRCHSSWPPPHNLPLLNLLFSKSQQKDQRQPSLIVNEELSSANSIGHLSCYYIQIILTKFALDMQLVFRQMFIICWQMVAYFTDIFCHGIASKKVSIQGTTNFMKGTAPQNPG